MKPLLLILLIILPLICTAQNQERYIKYLDAALAAAEKKDSVKIIENLEYFSTAIEVDNITPEKLEESTLSRYIDILILCNKVSLVVEGKMGNTKRQITLPANYQEKIVPFLEFKMEEKPQNLFLLGNLYYYDPILKSKNKDKIDKAVDFYEKAGRKGYLDAMFVLGQHYFDSDLQKCFYWLEKAASEGHQNSTLWLADLFFQGFRSTPKDYQKALHYYKKSAEQGELNSAYNVSTFYFYGRGVVKDLQEAKKWLLIAADSNHVNANINLAKIYELEEDYNLAVRRLESISHLDDINANENLGILYVKYLKDYSKAMPLVKKCANANRPKSQHLLGIIYENGLSTKKDKKQAKYWYEKACENGDNEACKKL